MNQTLQASGTRISAASTLIKTGLQRVSLMGSLTATFGPGLEMGDVAVVHSNTASSSHDPT